ncbi:MULTISPECIES: HlyC/CorC family transporter [Pacificibacter]|uniref:HlyC/CorC family transporter n=1 Tax=Pacificibacter TaxID=1042323 RepID=UPI001C080191|nr:MULTISPECIES: HlyC/CorC family transporter [Pacificibacter]MBU2936875.1 HlyC/CorC family transporter [Pacificibacter marinus]MDO6614869.1 HlyC/CorC family transporter [Pacificibacter sp. 1_MG-2023]
MDITMLDAAFWMTSAAIFGLLVLSGFFSGSETALTAASRGKLRAQADKGAKGAQKALDVTEDNERLIGSVLLGNNLVNILATSLATALFTRVFGESGVALATLVMTGLVLVFAEVLPKTYAITNPETAAARVAKPISAVVLIFSPVVSFVRMLVRGMLRLFGVQTDPDSHFLALKDEIAGAIALGHVEGAVEKEDRDRLLGALDLGERTVEEIMLHRSKIEMIDADTPPRDVLEACLKSPHTRLPLYRDDPENIVGVIHAKDLLRGMYAERVDAMGDTEFAAFDVMGVTMEPYFVPETTTLDDQMRQFLRRQTHFALVVDEYGALQGLITLEDILEEIVGEITDEFDQSENAPVKSKEGGWVVDGGMTIRDFNRSTECNLPDDEANTMAGLVIHEAQMIPTAGQVFSFHGHRFEVVARKDNRLSTLKVRPLRRGL